MPFKSLSAVSYSPSIVTMAVYVAVCEIFSVNEWRDLENLVRGRSRLLKMAPFDRPCMTISPQLYLYLYPVPFSSYLTYNNIVTVKSGLEVTQGHWNWCNSIAWVQFPIRLL